MSLAVGETARGPRRTHSRFVFIPAIPERMICVRLQAGEWTDVVPGRQYAETNAGSKAQVNVYTLNKD